jgi:hypothetical protein
MELFAELSLRKVRFNLTPLGKHFNAASSETCESLWELELPQLEILTGIADKALQNVTKSYFGEVSKTNRVLELQFETLKYIGGVKKAEKTARLEAAKKAEERAKLLELKDKKKLAAMETMTEEEIEKRLAELD